MKQEFRTADDAFYYLYKEIDEKGIDYGNGTKALLNIGFKILEPWNRRINSRNWSLLYAEREWEWYLSKNRSVEQLKKHAPIWDRMHSGDNIVNSNYGYQWSRNNQLEKTVDQLLKDRYTRQAWITIFDGKEKDEQKFDTPCTLNIGFKIIDQAVCMTVIMRSNDLWYGFCNDQYCFSKLQESVVDHLNSFSQDRFHMGWYYHFAHDMHLYEAQQNKNTDQHFIN